MINLELKNNWLKLLNFNKNREILKDLEKSKETVRIPLTPITLNANILYHLFEILYPIFINDQNNVLDVILAETGKRNKVIGLYLYETKKAGIFTSVETLPEDLVKIKNLDIEDLDEKFNKIQSKVLKEKKIRISSIRIYKKEALEMINSHCNGIKQFSIYEFFNRFTYLIQQLIQKDLFSIYPEPILINFLKNSLNLSNKIQLRNLFKLFEEILPEFRISLLLRGDTINLVILLQKKMLISGLSDLTIKFFTLNELGIDFQESNLNRYLNLIQQKLKTKKSYLLNQKDIISFLMDIFELLIPLKRDNIKLLLQKALFGYRSFKQHWNVVPRPLIYNTLIRFLVRLFGFNLNLRKISHWAIPETIFNYIDFFIGLNSKILLVITDIKKNKENKIQDKISKSSCNYLILIDSEESAIKRLNIINKEEIFAKSSFSSIEFIRNAIYRKYGFLSAILIIDKLLIQTFIQTFIGKRSKTSLFPRIKLLKLLKNKRYLRIYPKFPFYKFLENKNSRSFIKLILPIIIDKHEF